MNAVNNINTNQKKTMENNFSPNNQPYYEKVKHLKIKAKVDLYDTKELLYFLIYISPYVSIQADHVFISRECEQLINKLNKTPKKSVDKLFMQVCSK